MKHKLIYSHSFIKLIFGKQSSGVSDGLTKDHKVIEIANCSQVLERVHLMPSGAAQRDLRSIQTERVAGLGPRQRKDMNQHFNGDTDSLVENTLGGEWGKWQGGECPSVGVLFFAFS